MKKRMLSLLFALMLLPGAALAVTEGKVEGAQNIDLTRQAENHARYLPDASYYDDDDSVIGWGAYTIYQETERDEFGDVIDVCQSAGLTPGEIARARELLAAYEKGERTGNGAAVLGVMENVKVGVYPLTPEAFDGERVYVLLTGACLTDEQLLDIIDAYHRLGLTFDPEGLNCRNCMRGGGIECSRFFTEEERERNMALIDMIHRGTLTQDMLDMEMESAVQEIYLDPSEFCGLDSFALRPYRSMTDEEMAMRLFACGVTRDEFDYLPYEKLASAICARFGAPLSMTLQLSMGMYEPMERDGQGGITYGEARQAVYASGQTSLVDGYRRFYVCSMDLESMDVIRAGWHYSHDDMEEMKQQNPDFAYVSHERLLSDESYTAAAMQAALEVGEEGLTFFDAGECSYNSWNCLVWRAALRDGRYLDVGLDPADASVHAVYVQRYPMWDM